MGADVNAKRHDGLTALMAACGGTSVALVQALLDAGAAPNAQDARGVTACHMAAEVGAADVVTLLVQKGADCTVMAQQAAITPLIVAAAAGEEEMTALLLAITTDVDAIHDDKSAMSALMAAASNGSMPIVTHLLGAGAKVSLRSPIDLPLISGQSPTNLPPQSPSPISLLKFPSPLAAFRSTCATRTASPR